LGVSICPIVSVAAEPIDVGTFRQLFIDEYAIAEMEGLQRTVQRPKKHEDNPIILGVHPWEQGVWGPAVPSALYDEGKIRLWYRAVYFTRPFGFVDAEQDPEVRGRQIADLLDSMVCQMAYAESRDGVHFEKPKLGIIDYKGSKDNNLVWGRYGDWANMVMKMPDEPDPNRRYRCIIWAKKEYGGYYGNIAIHSPDGLNWTLGPKPAQGALDHAYNYWYDPFRKEWISLIQYASVPKRTLGRMVSKDFVNWTERGEVLVPDDKDPPGTEFYIGTIMMIDQLYLCFLHIFHTGPGKYDDGAPRQRGTRDIQLATSRDGIHWERTCDRQVFLPNGPKGAFDQSMVMFVGPPVEFENQLLLYYSATKGEHGSTNRTRAIGLARLRPDGFVALEPKGTKGMMTTQPFRVEGKKLLVNADASRGAVTVEILDADGVARPGFGLTDAEPLASDTLAHEVTWKGHSDCSAFMGKVVRLRFGIKQAKLYGFRFQ
jgi:predicted GH43/DUF377 family glycosyl hydrolase